jgi:hypothetical protein
MHFSWVDFVPSYPFMHLVYHGRKDEDALRVAVKQSRPVGAKGTTNDYRYNLLLFSG